MSSTNIIIPIIIVTVIVVSLILITRNHDSTPTPSPVDGFNLTSATIASQNITPTPLKISDVTKDGQDFFIPGSDVIINPTFDYVFTTTKDVSKLRNILVVDYILSDPNDNFFPNDKIVGKMLLNNDQRSRDANTVISILDDFGKIYKIIHIFDLTNIPVTSKTFKINSTFMRRSDRIGTPTASNLSEVKMFEQ